MWCWIRWRSCQPASPPPDAYGVANGGPFATRQRFAVAGNRSRVALNRFSATRHRFSVANYPYLVAQDRFFATPKVFCRSVKLIRRCKDR